MPKFLLTFTGPDGARYEKAVEAKNSDEAMHIGYSMNMRYKGYDNLWVEEYPYDSAGIFGFEVETEHKHFGKQREYVFIKANNLDEATRYYNKNIRGKYFNHSKKIIPESEGWQKFGRIIRSYSAATDRFDFDATDNYVGGSNMPRKFTKYPNDYVSASSNPSEDYSRLFIEDIKHQLFDENDQPQASADGSIPRFQFWSWVGDGHSFIINDGDSYYRVTVTKELD